MSRCCSANALAVAWGLIGRWPRQTRRHHRRPQRQIQLAHCRSAASGGAQGPREVRTIKDRITQRRHKDFIDVFERELAEKKG